MAQTFLFADLCGFTEYTQRHGDQRAAELALAFHRRVCGLAREEGCELVKSIGDAVMVRADDVGRAVRLARRVISIGEVEGCPPVRIGVDSGSAVQHDGDWYGSTVNTAARVTNAARPGQLVLTARARAAIAGQTSYPHVAGESG